MVGLLSIRAEDAPITFGFKWVRGMQSSDWWDLLTNLCHPSGLDQTAASSIQAWIHIQLYGASKLLKVGSNLLQWYSRSTRLNTFRLSVSDSSPVGLLLMDVF